MDSRVCKLIESIDGSSGNIRWDLKSACRELNLDISYAYAAQLFKRHTGLGVREYANRQRCLRAAERLSNTQLPIKMIAEEFGYRHASDFTRFLRGHRLLNRGNDQEKQKMHVDS